ncbi:MAG TPA: hypothetical protein VLA90_04140 [Actinomycetota bacterium]|nr:hypothetical protein [Actinomycetota bacterium]
MSELREVFEMVTKQTEPELDVWREQERRQRRHTNRRRVGVYALVVLLAIGGAALAVSLLRQGDPAGVPADDPNEVPIERPEGAPPTAEGLAGFWLEDVTERGISGTGVPPTVVWFTADGQVRLDNGADLAFPYCRGTYALDGDRIAWDCGNDEFVTRAGLTEDGWLRAVVVESRAAPAPVGARRGWMRVFPGSPASEAIRVADDAEFAPHELEDLPSLQGVWVSDDGELLLMVGLNGAYEIHEASGLGVEPADVGTVEIIRGSVAFTSGSDSPRCADGDRMIWTVERGSPAPAPGIVGVLRSSVDDDGCSARGGLGLERTWLRLSTR